MSSSLCYIVLGITGGGYIDNILFSQYTFLMQQKALIILGNILSVLLLIPALLLLVISLVPFTDGTPPPTPAWYMLLIIFIAIASVIFVLISIDYSHRKKSIKWAYAPFLVFGIIGSVIFIIGTFRLQRANQIENQNYINYRNTPHPSRMDALNQSSQ